MSKIKHDKEKGDMDILNHALIAFGNQLNRIPYKGIPIKEALIYIGYSNEAIDIKV